MVAVAGATTAILLGTDPVFAQSKPAAKPAAGPKHLGTFGAFDAYTNGDGAAKVCYLVGKPKTSTPKSPARKDAYLTVTNRANPKTAGEVSVRFGAKLKEAADGAELTVGKEKLKLFTKDDAAWALDAKADAQIAAVFEKGDLAVFKAQPVAKGADLIDSYDLNGFGKARKAINDACK